MCRSKPYTTNQTNVSSLLQKALSIPMNQREYSWIEQQILQFLEDIFQMYEEGKYVLKMGSIINLSDKNENFIYDGQQRILTLTLILIAMGRISNKLYNKIKSILTVDSDLDELTEEQKKIKDECHVELIPRLSCINPFDMKGLVDIINENINHWIDYLDLTNITNYSQLNNLDEYTSKEGVKITRKSDFIRHLEKKTAYKQPDNSTKLFKAYNIIYNYFKIKNYNENEMVKLYKFIMNDIDVQYFDCNDINYVSKIFDWENNRGIAVERLDINKNQILVKCSNEQKMEVYDKWEKLKRRQDNIVYDNIGEKLFNVALQLRSGKIERKPDTIQGFKSIINSDNTYEEIIKFFKIVERLFDIMDQIKKDKFGRLLNHSKRVRLNFEAYMWCLLPIFYKKNKIDEKLIKIDEKLIHLMTKWYFRNLQFRNRNFNNLCYSNEFLKISNLVLADKDYNYYNDILKCLLHNKDDNISISSYEESMKYMNFKSTNATHLLLFLETCLNTDIVDVPLDFTLEHIVPRDDFNKGKMKDESLKNNIGNLTLLEKKNSINGHKGNSSLKNNCYDKKKKAYKGSASIITRQIEEKFPTTFEEDKIILRNKIIVDLLNEYSNY